MEAIFHVIRTECDGRDNFHIDSHVEPVREAITQQRQIGTLLMLRGFLAKGWHIAMVDAGVRQANQRMNALQKIIWEYFFEPIWKTRKEIFHRSNNRYNAEENRQMAARIIWYVQHKNDILAHHDRFLTEIDVTKLLSLRVAFYDVAPD